MDIRDDRKSKNKVALLKRPKIQLKYIHIKDIYIMYLIVGRLFNPGRTFYQIINALLSKSLSHTCAAFKFKLAVGTRHAL